MRFNTPTKLSVRKLSFLGITMMFVVWYLSPRTSHIIDKQTGYHVEQRNITLHFDQSQEKEPGKMTTVLPSSVDVQEKQRSEEKFIMAFSYWELSLLRPQIVSFISQPSQLTGDARL